MTYSSARWTSKTPLEEQLQMIKNMLKILSKHYHSIFNRAFITDLLVQEETKQLPCIEVLGTPLTVEDIKR